VTSPATVSMKAYALTDGSETSLYLTESDALAALKAQWNCPTVEHGKNRYGLDVAYFRNLFNRELNRTLQDYRPHELARNLLRMARTADESVIAEAEFSGALKSQWQAEAVNHCEKEVTASVNVLLKPHIAGVFAVIRQRTQEPR